MSARRIVGICDDTKASREEWKEALGRIPEFHEQFDTELIVAEDAADREFGQALKGLTERRKLARAGSDEGRAIPNLFDRISLLIVDYDLLNAATGDGITGEEVAYLVRCYSNCGVLVSINQFGTNPFDLDLTCHFPESFADLNLGDTQVKNPGLWNGEWRDGFRPWYWPLLPKLIEDMDHRTDDVLADPDQPLIRLLGFRETAWQLLPKDTIAKVLLSHTRKPSQEVTVRDVVNGSPLGLRFRDKSMDDRALARIAAARIGQWLDYAVLSAQDILVDAPHLVERYRSLAGSNPTADQLNAFARIVPRRNSPPGPLFPTDP